MAANMGEALAEVTEAIAAMDAAEREYEESFGVPHEYENMEVLRIALDRAEFLAGQASINFLRTYGPQLAQEAGRYRWLRKMPSYNAEISVGSNLNEGPCILQGYALDAAIDAAMKAGE